jgi:mRNA-degrading endonuclease RelE of RelBE toxin-antitoxin system
LYVPFFSDDFNKNFRKLTKKDNNLKNRIMQQVEEMKIDPFRNSIELEYDLKGKRRIRVGDYRLIYAVCDDCRKKGYDRLNQCYECGSKGNDAMVFFDIIHRSQGYDRL